MKKRTFADLKSFPKHAYIIHSRKVLRVGVVGQVQNRNFLFHVVLPKGEATGLKKDFMIGELARHIYLTYEGAKAALIKDLDARIKSAQEDIRFQEADLHALLIEKGQILATEE